MRKFLKLSLCLLLIAGLAGCGGKASTEKQEKVVTDFFVNLKAGDIDKVTALCTKDNVDVKDFTSAMDSFKTLQDVDAFGDTFVGEAQKFVKEFFNQLVSIYEVKGAKKDGENYKVQVNVTMKDVDFNTFSITESQKLAQTYQTAHMDELQKIYLKDGREALEKAIYTGIAADYFKLASEGVAKSEEVKYAMTFTLVPNGDSWLISKSTGITTK